MATCAIADISTGALSATATAPGDCTGFILLSVEDYDQLAAAAWWSGMTLDDGALVTAAILAVWGVGWAFAQIARVFTSTEGDKHYE